MNLPECRARPAHSASPMPVSIGEGFDVIVRSITPLIERHARRVLGHQEDAEDLRQEVLWAIHRAWPHYRGAARFETWVVAITLNHARNALRRRRRRPCTVPALSALPAGQSLGDADPYERLLARRLLERLEEALAVLSAEQRQVVVDASLSDASMEELARRFETTSGTIKSRLSRGRALLREVVERGRGA